MLNSILWMAIVAAGVAALAAYVMTGSFVWAIAAYAGSGMSVLFAILVAEVLFGDEAEVALEESGLVSDQQS